MYSKLPLISTPKLIKVLTNSHDILMFVVVRCLDKEVIYVKKA